MNRRLLVIAILLVSICAVSCTAGVIASGSHNGMYLAEVTLDSGGVDLPENISDLVSMDEKQLNELTKEELIAIILGDRTETVCTLSEGDTRGMIRQIWETRDCKGSLLSVSDTKWTYYTNGDVNTITVKSLDSKEMTSLIVKHEKSNVISTTSSKTVVDMSKETVSLGKSQTVEGKEIIGIK